MRLAVLARPASLLPPVDLYGIGSVGRAFQAALAAAGGHCASLHDSKGCVAGESGTGAVLVDATAPRYEGAAAAGWADRIAAALGSGQDVVTCNKAPLATAWARLQDASADGGGRLAASATVGAGTPVLATLSRLHEVSGITRVQASLSGTLSYVVAAVAAGSDLPDAVAAAQAAGFAEPDPSLDLDGTDAFAKAVIIHNRLWPEDGPLGLHDRLGPLHLDAAAIQAIAQQGLTPAVQAHITPGRARLALTGVPRGTAQGPTAIEVQAHLADGSLARLSGQGAGAHATAGALLADLRALGGEHGG